MEPSDKQPIKDSDIEQGRQPEPNPNREYNPYRTLALVSALGVELAVSILAGVLLGKWADTRFGTGPIFLMSGLLLGMGFGFYSVYSLVRKFL